MATQRSVSQQDRSASARSVAPAKAARSRIQRDSSVSLYAQIADRLAAEISSGRYKAFARLPSEQTLMDRYGVSRVTVRQAIALLASQGVVATKQGKGTFVSGPVVRHELANLRGFYDELVRSGNAPQTRLLKFGPARAEPQVAQLLGGTDGETVFLERLYLLEGRAFALARAWLPPLAKAVSWGQAETNPLYSILENLLDQRVTQADVSILARTCDGEEAKLLRLPKHSPVLVMERNSYSREGKALEHSRFTVRPDNYRFCLSVQGPLAITRQIQLVAPARRPPAASKRRANA